VWVSWKSALGLNDITVTHVLWHSVTFVKNAFINSVHCVTKCIICSPLKADTHIACRAHAVLLSCRVVPLMVYNVSSPFDLHSAAVSDSHLPCRAPTMPFFWRPQHSTAVERRPVGDLPAIGFWLPRGVAGKLLSESYLSQIHVAGVTPNVCHRRGKAYYFVARTWVLV